MAVDAEVVVVGAGPVGLTLAIDLGQRGVRCVLLERKRAPEFLPKMERCNARTMEIYRRMGLAERIRQAGFRQHYPMDVFIVTSLDRPPILRLPYPSVQDARAEIASRNDGTVPLEPYQLISQYTLEPLLKAVAESLPAVSVRYGHELVDLQQDVRGVRARVVCHEDGRSYELQALYLVGCDGGSSTVRELLGIPLEGEANLLELRQALIRCEELWERLPFKGRHYHVADRQQTMFIVQDDAEASTGPCWTRCPTPASPSSEVFGSSLTWPRVASRGFKRPCTPAAAIWAPTGTGWKRCSGGCWRRMPLF